MILRSHKLDDITFFHFFFHFTALSCNYRTHFEAANSWAPPLNISLARFSVILVLSESSFIGP